MTRARTPLFAALAATLAACVEPALGTETAPVIGGQPATAGQFPGVGALVIDAAGQVMLGCTGTLIAPDVVLTAGHCVAPGLTGGVTPGFTLALDVTAGAPPPTVVAGRQALAHESFTLDIEPFDGLGELYDVGLLFLDTPITSVPPVRMPTPDHAADLVPELDLQIVGYGRTDPTLDTYGVLFHATTKLVSLNPTELQVGGGAPQPQNCNGDSGGPALADLGDGPRIVGIVSRSFAGSECVTGGIDTRVDAYLTWIHGKVPTGIPDGSGLSGYDGDDGGCCSSSGSGGGATGALTLGLVVVGLIMGRRRRARTPA